MAEAQGRRLDAVALYTKAIATGFVPQEVRQRARSLWDAQGGTEEGWRSATAHLPAPKPPEKLSVRVADEFAVWKGARRTLPEMSLRDLAGKAWTLAELNGKTTFVNSWATWCIPCRDELPALQKLYELARSRPDIQVITLNMDDNPGAIQPFIQAHGYTFPVLTGARPYLESVTGPLVIPQNWIVDAAGTLQEKSVGFDQKVNDWPQAMLQRLLRASGPSK